MTLEERISHIIFAESSQENRALFLQMIDDKEEGDAFFINTCVMTFDPRLDANNEAIGPVAMLLWPKQEEITREFGLAMDNSYDIGGEKSRDVGFTWIVLALLVKRWLRKPAFSCLIGHYVDDLIDSSSDTSLFWRIDFILKHLPPFLLPNGFNLQSKAWRSFGKLINEKTNASITGMAPTERFGVGGRYSVVYFDDWARWEHGGSAYKSNSATTRCRITTWTVNPDNPMNHAYELRFQKGEFKNVKCKIVNCKWTDDPRKMVIGRHPVTGQPCNLWKLAELGDSKYSIPGRISQETFDYEHGMVYEVARVGLIYAEQLARVRVGDFPYNPRFPLYSVVDNGVGDTCVILWIQWDWQQYRYRVVDCYHTNGQGAKFYIPILLGKKNASEILPHEGDYDQEAWDRINRHTGWQQFNRGLSEYVVPYTTHFGDPATKNRGSSDGKSFRQVLSEGRDGAGDGAIYLVCNELARDHRSRREESRRVLPYTDINEETCGHLISSIKNYKWNKAGTEPQHDWASHAASAFQYFCVNDPHRDEFQMRSIALSNPQSMIPINVFGDMSAIPVALQKEILASQAKLSDPFNTQHRTRTEARDNRDVYTPNRGIGGYGVGNR